PQFTLIRPMIRHVVKHADALIAVAQSLKGEMVKLGASHEKVTVVHNGVDVLKFRPESRLAMRGMLGLPPDRPIVLSVGHLIETKGFHILIEAIANLRAR